jgi:hypothetical protein
MDETGLEISEEERLTFNRIMGRSSLWIFIGLPLFGTISYFILLLLSGLLIGLFQLQHNIVRQPSFLLLGAFFMGLYINVPFIQIILKLIYKEKYQYYEKYYDKYFGFDNRKVGTILLIFYILIICGSITLYLYGIK